MPGEITGTAFFIKAVPFLVVKYYHVLSKNKILYSSMEHNPNKLIDVSWQLHRLIVTRMRQDRDTDEAGS